MRRRAGPALSVQADAELAPHRGPGPTCVPVLPGPGSAASHLTQRGIWRYGLPDSVWERRTFALRSSALLLGRSYPRSGSSRANKMQMAR